MEVSYSISCEKTPVILKIETIVISQYEYFAGHNGMILWLIMGGFLLILIPLYHNSEE